VSISDVPILGQYTLIRSAFTVLAVPTHISVFVRMCEYMSIWCVNVHDALVQLSMKAARWCVSCKQEGLPRLPICIYPYPQCLCCLKFGMRC
jgi:hypothetical protein